MNAPCLLQKTGEIFIPDEGEYIVATIRPFQAFRPRKDKVEKIAALPYDVYDREEARKVVQKNPESFLCIDRADTQFGEEVDPYASCVYQKAREIMEQRIAAGDFVQENMACYYLYELTMHGRSQTGIVACASIDDYHDNIIKKHENTRKEKEQDRICHVDALSMQTGPIFLAYRKQDAIEQIVAQEKKETPLYDFVADDGVRHRVFRITKKAWIQKIRQTFEGIHEIYIADGHHRAASAVHVGDARRRKYPDYDGSEEFNYFLAVLFPEDELYIMDYNRVVKDLNGDTQQQFLEKVKTVFDVKKLGSQEAVPKKKGEIGMFLQDTWYLLKIREAERSNDVVAGLDVSVLQDKLLKPVLGIENPKMDTRIDFVGGIRGLGELVRRVQTDCCVAFAMYPTSSRELFEVADAGRLMPPKSTWFEPKLRSGLFLHQIER